MSVRTHVRFAVLSALAASAMAVACSTPVADRALDSQPPQTVVYFDGRSVSLSELESRLARDFSFGAARGFYDRKLIGPRGLRLSAAVFDVPAWLRRSGDDEWKEWTMQVETMNGVLEVEQHVIRRRRGAPSSKPILDGDMDRADVLSQDALTQINASAAHLIATGDGVTVAVLDGGLDLRHEMLAGVLTLSGEYDAIDDDTDAQDLGNGTDDDSDGVIDNAVGHGTFVAGLISAAAPDAQILPIRVMDDEGGVTDLALWLGISHAVTEGADVINMSLVAENYPQGLEDAIEDAVNDGIAIVSAAGNDSGAPGDHASVMANSTTVGAVDGDDDLASFSPTGNDVDVYGPGVDIKGPIGGDIEDSYGWWDGTSFACAFVSAAAALVKEVDSTVGTAAMTSQLENAVNSATNVTPSTRGVIDLELAADE